MVGDNLAPRTRLTLNGRFGVELQNDTFPANSADPNFSSTLGESDLFVVFDNLNAANQGPRRLRPNAVAWVYQANLAVNSKLVGPTSMGSLSYSFDGRSVHLEPDSRCGPAVSARRRGEHIRLCRATELVQPNRQCPADLQHRSRRATPS